MSDIALVWNTDAGAADFELDGADLLADDGLETAVMLSLFLDRRAEDSDVLPDGETDRRGWWGDSFPTVAGDKIGSRLWLLGRAKNTPDVKTRAVEYAREALQWLLDDLVASAVDVESEIMDNRILALGITIHRPEVDPVTFRYNYNWAAQEARISS
jgi:phage gp46-like protein